MLPAPYEIHPVIVHFPIALLFTAAIFQWLLPLAWKTQAGQCQWAAACMLWAGTVFAALTVASGLWAEATVPAIPSAYDTVEWHEKSGIATGVLALILSVWRWFQRPPAVPRPWLLHAALWLLLVVALGITGFLGGRLVFQFAVGVQC